MYKLEMLVDAIALCAVILMTMAMLGALKGDRDTPRLLFAALLATAAFIGTIGFVANNL